jgi:hypothetical protein
LGGLAHAIIAAIDDVDNDTLPVTVGWRLIDIATVASAQKDGA